LVGGLTDTIAGTIEKTGAEIQTKVAEFLACRGKLVQLKGAGDASLQNEVNTLIKVQDQLEEELSSVLELIRQAKLGQWSNDLVTQAPFFYYKMVQQINDVSRTVKLSQGSSGINLSSPWVLAGGAVLLILLLRR
jgi:hypothetical protein